MFLECVGIGVLPNGKFPRGEEWYFSMMEKKINLLKEKMHDMYGISKVSMFMRKFHFRFQTSTFSLF